MKARIGGRTTLEGLPTVMREVIEVTAQQRAEERWKELREDITRCFIYSVALALNDVYGFGTVRVRRVINAIGEITEGYSDDSYTPSEKREGTKDLKRMADVIQEEMKNRGLFI